MKTKTAKETYTLTTQLVLPNDTNNLDHLFGGRLMQWIDIIAAISAQKACNRTVVTASVDNLVFKSGIKQNEIVTLEAKVTRAFNSSMEIRVEVHAENLFTSERRLANVAYSTFVAIDQSGNPIPVTTIVPESEDEKAEFEGAARRRELRLVMAGRMEVKDATHLVSLMSGKTKLPTNR